MRSGDNYWLIGGQAHGIFNIQPDGSFCKLRASALVDGRFYIAQLRWSTDFEALTQHHWIDEFM